MKATETADQIPVARYAVNSLHEVRLGGVNQWVLLRGQDRSRPVLLMLHGSKDSAFPYARYLGRTARLEESFVVAYWDRRGSGKSATREASPDSITIEQYVSDTLELAAWLKERFRSSKIVLLGVSVGSLVGMLALATAPQLFGAYVAMGQYTNDTEAGAFAYRIAVERAQRAGDSRATHALAEIGPPPHSFEQSWRFFEVAAKVGPYADMPELRPSFSARLLMTILRTPGYSLRDKLRMLRKGGSCLECLLPQLARYDLPSLVRHVDVPAVFLQGRLDYQTPGGLVERYVNELDAHGGKHLVWLERSGHLVAPDDLAQLGDVLANVAKQVTDAGATVTDQRRQQSQADLDEDPSWPRPPLPRRGPQQPA